MKLRSFWITALFLLLCADVARAHVGSPDVYVRGDAGPYTVYVSVHPPVTLPGAAEIEVRTGAGNGAGAPEISSVTLISGNTPPVTLQAYPQEQKFVGTAWVPGGARVWSLDVQVNGSEGMGKLTLPVTLPPSAPKHLRWILPAIFGGAGMLMLAFIWRRRGMASRSVLLVCGALMLLLTAWSFKRIAADRTLAPALQIEMQGDTLHLKLSRAPHGHILSDIVADHDHLMHLFLVHQPQMDVLLHLHPTLLHADKDSAEFIETMPPMAPGGFAIYADIAHGDGVAETATATAGLPMQSGLALTGDDSVGNVSRQVGEGCGSSTRLMDGYSMSLECIGTPRVKTGILLRVTLRDQQGTAPAGMVNYMGMGGHAAIFARDGSVFAHIHPMGTVMPSVAMSGPSMSSATMSGMTMSEMTMPGMEMPVSNTVEFPYGFPVSGPYRIFVQMKHDAVVETGAFDLNVP